MEQIAARLSVPLIRPANVQGYFIQNTNTQSVLFTKCFIWKFKMLILLTHWKTVLCTKLCVDKSQMCCVQPPAPAHLQHIQLDCSRTIHALNLLFNINLSMYILVTIQAWSKLRASKPTSILISYFLVIVLLSIILALPGLTDNRWTF